MGKVEVPTDRRFTRPLYRIENAAWFLRVPEGTLAQWVRGRGNARPIVSSVAAEGRLLPTIPFVGLAEALVVRTLRRTDPKMSMQKIRKGLDRIKDEIGLEHALVSRRLKTDGVELFYDYAHEDSDFGELAEVISQNYVLDGVLEGQLKIIAFDDDGWADRLTLPFVPDRAIVQVRTDRAFGRPVFIRGGARLQDVLTRFRAGEPLEDVVRDFGVPIEDVLDILRGFVPQETS